jgi:threonine dehydrogenase-like Zn-dependent dehydrogenase
MRAVAVTEPGKLELVQLDRPRPGPYQAVVKTDLAALCNATDGKLVVGHFPGVDRYPLILGHESTGIVEEVGPKVRNFKAGDRAIGGLLFEFSDPKYASGWGGFGDYTLVNDHDAMVVDGAADAPHGWVECYEIQRSVDADIPAAEAVLLCTWREVFGGFGDFQLQPKDDILIFGAGPVGLSFVKFARLLGLGWVGTVDPLESKRQRALAMGADAAFAPGDPALKELVKSRGKPLDAVIDAVGNVACINAGLPLVKLGGSVCVYGVISAPQLLIDKAAGPYNFNLFVHQWPTRRREREAQKPLCEWIRQGKLRADEFVTHEFAVEQVETALAAARSGEAVKCLLRF